MKSKRVTLVHLAVLLLCNRVLSLHNFHILKHTRFSVVNDLRITPTRKVFAIQASEDATPSNRRGIIETVGSFFNRLRRNKSNEINSRNVKIYQICCE